MPPARDPVIEQLKKTRRGDHIAIKAHLLNEANQEKVKEYAEQQGEVTIFSVQGAIGLDGLRRFSGVLCKHVSTLTRVSLRANNLRMPAVLDLICALQLPQNNALELLDLSSNPIGCEGFKALAKNVMLNTTLSVLLLSQCSIGDSGVVPSAAWIQGKVRPASGRFYLNLSRNNVGVEGQTTLAGALPGWMSLSLTRQKPPVLQQTTPVGAPAAAPAVVVGSPMEGAGGDSASSDSESSSDDEEEEEEEEKPQEPVAAAAAPSPAEDIPAVISSPTTVTSHPPATLKTCVRKPTTTVRKVRLANGKTRTTVFKKKQPPRRLVKAKMAQEDA